jgi:hypothetical protein
LRGIREVEGDGTRGDRMRRREKGRGEEKRIEV